MAKRPELIDQLFRRLPSAGFVPEEARAMAIAAVDVRMSKPFTPPERSPFIPPMMRTQDVADVLRCDESTVRRLTRIGQLTAVRIGGMVRYRRAEVERLIEGPPCPAPTEGTTLSAVSGTATGSSNGWKPERVTPEQRARAIAAARRQFPPGS
jgi:excisionase family DNA binding protein